MLIDVQGPGLKGKSCWMYHFMTTYPKYIHGNLSQVTTCFFVSRYIRRRNAKFELNIIPTPIEFLPGMQYDDMWDVTMLIIPLRWPSSNVNLRIQIIELLQLLHFLWRQVRQKSQFFSSPRYLSQCTMDLAKNKNTSVEELVSNLFFNLNDLGSDFSRIL